MGSAIAGFVSMPRMNRDVIVYFADGINNPFVRNDIGRVAARNNRVLLFSVVAVSGKDTLPRNVDVVEDYIDWSRYQPLKLVWRNLLSISGIYIRECWNLRHRLPPGAAVARLVSNKYKADCVMVQLRRLGVDAGAATFYSFWFYDCLFLAWLRRNWKVGPAVARAHGGDLFEDRGSIKGQVLLRHFQFRYLSGVYPVSETGTAYLKKKYTQYSRKFDTIFLGSPFHRAMSPFRTEGEFVLVSCATVRNIKRIYAIAEMLTHIQFPLVWYHLGDENLTAADPTMPRYAEAKRRLTGHAFVRYVPVGECSNDRVFEFYAGTPVHLFISLSEAEGLPVSMLEAMSFGIPVLATDVGGCRELVNDDTGILVDLNTEPKRIAELIGEFRNSSRNSQPFREGVRAFWEKRFVSDNNYQKLFSKLEERHESS